MEALQKSLKDRPEKKAPARANGVTPAEDEEETTPKANRKRRKAAR
jgi:hypothetical protein